MPKETGCEEVRAVRDIAVGEEVCVNYFGECPLAALYAALQREADRGREYDVRIAGFWIARCLSGAWVARAP